MSLTRRGFLAATPFLAAYRALAAAALKKHRIRDVEATVIEGGRTYTLVRVTTEEGISGIGEAYGTPGVGVKEQVLSLKPWLAGKDPLEIDVLYSGMGDGTKNLSGTRTDGSAHNLMRAVSGIEMALWDLAGKALGVPATTLLGGKFRERVKVYDHAAPKNMLDKASCREWADKVKSDKSGFTTHKFGFPHSDTHNRVLSTKDLMNIQRGFENCREAVGWDHDIMVHCHWEYDLRTSIQISQAVEGIRPVWLEDPLPVDYTDSWKRLSESSKVPICAGENLTRRQGFKDFILNQGCDILHPDLRNSGGFLETKRVADMAAMFGLPMANHNTGSQVCTYSTIQWGASIEDYIACETVTGQGGWMDQLLVLDGPYIENGSIRVPDRPGLGIELNPDVVRAHLAAGEKWWG